MPVVTRSNIAPTPAKQSSPSSSVEIDECAICLQPIDCASCVVLVCKHKFHGQCAVRHLQTDRRCPLCRVSGTRTRDANDDYEADFIEEAESIVIARLEKLPESTLRTVLRDYKVSNSDIGNSDKQGLVEMVSEQLHYETDSDDDDDDDDDDDIDDMDDE